MTGGIELPNKKKTELTKKKKKKRKENLQVIENIGRRQHQTSGFESKIK